MIFDQMLLSSVTTVFAGVDNMEFFNRLKDQLFITEDDRLMLGGVPMILTPRWFLVGIMKRVAEKAGPELASDIFYEAAFEGAYKWSRVQMENGLNGRAVMEQYLGSMTHRGWGRFEIIDFEPENGKGRFRFYNSAVALEYGKTGSAVCVWVPGALAGGFQAILDPSGYDLKVKGRETTCLSQGFPHCEFTVEPV